jgi:hypothetical protein
MNILDENIIASQRQRLRGWRIPVRQIGVDIARKGLQDEEIIPFLHHLRGPTFFTRDRGFYRREVCHRQYGIVCLEVAQRRLLSLCGVCCGTPDCIHRQNAWAPSCEHPTEGSGYGDSTPKKRR